MKLSKSLLKAVALGLVIGGTATACTSILEEKEEITIDRCGTEVPGNSDPVYDCPACGMG